MANQLLTFMDADDEKAFLRFLERFHFEVYPRRVPPDWRPFRATADALPDFPPEDVYLVASDIGPALVDPIKRGPDKGHWRIDEVRSPVIFWERCLTNDDGELLSGELWAELDVTAQTGRRSAAPDRFRARYLQIEAWLRKSFRKSNPRGYLIGPATARRVKEGALVLRENRHWGRAVALH
jgi:hypothetical protein